MNNDIPQRWNRENHTDYTAKYEKYRIAEDETVSMDVDTKDGVRDKLKKYRLDKSREEQMKPYYIFTNQQLDALVETMPKDKTELLSISGFGEKKVEKYGDDILRLLLEQKLQLQK